MAIGNACKIGHTFSPKRPGYQYRFVRVAYVKSLFHHLDMEFAYRISPLGQAF
jgi:hypothetical protein